MKLDNKPLAIKTILAVVVSTVIFIVPREWIGEHFFNYLVMFIVVAAIFLIIEFSTKLFNKIPPKQKKTNTLDNNIFSELKHWSYVNECNSYKPVRRYKTETKLNQVIKFIQNYIREAQTAESMGLTEGDHILHTPSIYKKLKVDGAYFNNFITYDKRFLDFIESQGIKFFRKKGPEGSYLVIPSCKTA